MTVSDRLSENINIIANEPSLAFFRIQEHVRKTLPQLVEQKVGSFVIYYIFLYSNFYLQKKATDA